MRPLANPCCRVLLVLALCFSLRAAAEDRKSLVPSNYVNDFAGVIDAATEEKLNALCQEVEQKTNAQIAVVTVKTLEGEEASFYTAELFKQWGVGGKKDDRGVLILLATQDRKYWTEVGYGLEPVLPDGKVGGFGREMVPHLRNGDYASAVTLNVQRVAQAIAADSNATLTGAAELPQEDFGEQGSRGILPFIPIIAIFFIIMLANRSGGRRRRGGVYPPIFWGGGGFGGGGGGFGGGGGGGFGGFGGGMSGGGGAGGSW